MSIFPDKPNANAKTSQNKEPGNPFKGKPAARGFVKGNDKKGSAKGNDKGAVKTEVKVEKTDWNKFKKDKKELKLKRKSSKAGFEKVQEAKQLYEQLKT